MFQKDLIPYAELCPDRIELLRERKSVTLNKCAWIIGMLFMCVLIMSLMIVRVSSAELFHRNQTETRIIDKNSYHCNYSSAQDIKVSGQRLVTTPSAAMRLKRRQQELDTQTELHAIAGETAYLLERADDTALEHEHEHERERAHSHNRDRDRNRVSNDDHEYEHEEPIYGIRRMKARRPQQQLVVAAAVANATVSPITAASITYDDRTKDGKPYQHHVYERLPRRSSTVTPIKSEMHNQIPRPPRLTSRQPSLLLRRHYLETPTNMSFGDAVKPKPFHFPHDGPQPEEFRKAEDERLELNNIQDILQHMHLGGSKMRGPQLMMMPTGLHIAGSYKNFKSSGIANFFRNRRNKKHMQLSFPISVPMPLPMFPGPYQPPPAFAGVVPQAYQRIALDQFYPYKPRSPNEINLLAMQQQLQANRSRSKNKKKQKQAAAAAAAAAAVTATASMVLPHGNQRPYIGDATHLLTYPQLMAYNATQKPALKHIPFKVNLDIYPVRPPSKAYKASMFGLEDTKVAASVRPTGVVHNPYSNVYPYALSPSVISMPYQNVYEQPIYSPAHYPAAVQSMAAQVLQPSESKVVFDDQLPRQLPQQQPLKQHKQQQIQQQQQKQLQQQPPFRFPPTNSQQPFQPIDYVNPAAAVSATALNSAHSLAANTKSNQQIMVHLNVFPKQKSSTVAPQSTNPFYGSTFNINRNTIQEDTDPSLAHVMELRNQPQNSNDSSIHAYTQQKQQQLSQLQFTQQQQQKHQQQQQQQQQQPKQRQQQHQSISRSDNFDVLPFVDFEEPIVAAEVPLPEQMPQPAALISNKLDSSSSSPHYDHIEARTHLNYNEDADVDQLATEAKAASLFRFPVEDLIQFQVGDAL